jgi:hypothetical protein
LRDLFFFTHSPVSFLNCSLASFQAADGGRIYQRPQALASQSPNSREMRSRTDYEEDCLLCCQGMQAYDANVSISSFHANLEYIRMELESDEEE